MMERWSAKRVGCLALGIGLSLMAARPGAAQCENVRLVGGHGVIEYAEDVSLSGGLAYIAGNIGGLIIVDVRNPTSPTLVGSYSIPGGASSIAVAGNTAYVGYPSGLDILDVSDPSQPTWLGSQVIGIDMPNAVRVSGSLAYVADFSNGLQIIDVSNPSQPTIIGSTYVGSLLDLWLSGRLAYLASRDGGLQIVDVSNPYQPTVIGSYTDGTGGYLSASSVHVQGNLAYVVEYYGRRLLVLDVSNPRQPILVGSAELNGSLYGVSVSGHLAYVADNTYGRLLVVDVTNPSQPVPCGSCYVGLIPQSVAVSNGLIYMALRSGGLRILQYTGEAPRLAAATLSDVNENGIIEGGDQLVLTLDRSVVVTTALLRASHFFLAVEGDTLGGAGFAVGVNPHNARQIVLTLGQGARLNAAGAFSTTTVAAGAPSGIDFATSLPFSSINSLDAISAIDGGLPGVDDSGIDVELSFVSGGRDIGPAGGQASVTPSPDAAYSRHELRVPAGALAETTTFRLRPPQVNAGVIGAVQIASSNPWAAFDPPAVVAVEYREGDVDFERGQIESEMRVRQLVENPPGTFEYIVVPGVQRLDTARRLASVEITSLNPTSSLGVVGIFAGLPIETVDERAVHIKPAVGGGLVREQGHAVLTPGPRGAYTLHRIEFPGYVETTASDPARLIASMRAATLAERVAQTGAPSFPEQSGAVFVVTMADAQGRLVEFTSPVVVTVQCKQRPNPDDTDIVRFGGRPAVVGSMRLVHDEHAGEAVGFIFADSPQTVNASLGTVTAVNLVGLTGADGKGTWGAVGRGSSTRAACWRLYR